MKWGGNGQRWCNDTEKQEYPDKTPLHRLSLHRKFQHDLAGDRTRATWLKAQGASTWATHVNNIGYSQTKKFVWFRARLPRWFTVSYILAASYIKLLTIRVIDLLFSISTILHACALRATPHWTICVLRFSVWFTKIRNRTWVRNDRRILPEAFHQLQGNFTCPTSAAPTSLILPRKQPFLSFVAF